MKNQIAHASLSGLFAITLIVSMAAPAHAAGPCSLARAAGNWALTDSGTVVGVGPRVAVGVFKLDASGNLTDGVAASSLAGTVASETFSGTYTVNPDCSGGFDVKIYSSGTEIFELNAFTAFDDDMREMRAVFTSAVPPVGSPFQTVISLQARKQ